MRTNYSVWEWTPNDGWTFFLGTNSRASADQVTHGLKYYQPQKWYAVYGSWSFIPISEITAQWRGTRYSWGYVSDQTPGWISVYALSKILSPEVVVGANRVVIEAMPDFMRIELAQRARGTVYTPV